VVITLEAVADREVVRLLPVVGSDVSEAVGEFVCRSELLLFAIDVEFADGFAYVNPRRKDGGS
jgi:hypothetical protein